MKTQWMIITPAMARDWLESRNTNNRNLARSKVDQYASDMRNGNWRASHQGIAFYEDGILADGQHRLKACAETGINLESFVTFGLSREAGTGIDSHRARKMDDQIKIAGMSDWIGKEELAIVKLAARCLNHKNLSTHDAVAYCEAHKDAITVARSCIGRKVRNITTAPVMLAMACAYAQVGGDAIRNFAKVLTSGVMDGRCDIAAIRLREKLLLDGSKFAHSDTARMELVKLTMRAIKAFANGEEIAKLFMPQAYLYPVLFNPVKGKRDDQNPSPRQQSQEAQVRQAVAMVATDTELVGAYHYDAPTAPRGQAMGALHVQTEILG